jgi:DNA-binding response OmpR family regulator
MITEAKKRDVALVVDDSPETLRLLTDALDGAGMTVMVAMDGAAAMRIVDQITPDIILLDAVMPGMDGFETCRRLKRDAGLSNVPVIFMTGLAETEHIVAAWRPAASTTSPSRSSSRKCWRGFACIWPMRG